MGIKFITKGFGLVFFSKRKNFKRTCISKENFYFSAPLRCYICVTDYEDDSQDPGCSISSRNVLIRACAVEHGFNRCISYRARNSRTGNVVFRRHCVTQEMCEYQCLFSHHTNCQRTCCQGDLCNDVDFGEYVGTSEKPEISRTTKDPDTTPNTTPKDDKSSRSTHNPTLTQTTTDAPVTTQNPTTPRDDSTESFQSTHNPMVTPATTSAPVTTHKTSTTERSLVGGPPSKLSLSARHVMHVIPPH
jgi:hypothetical protein